MKTFRVQLGQWNWAANAIPQPIKIDRGNLLRRLIVYIDGDHDLAAGAASGTARSESVANIFQYIRVKANSTEPIKDFDGAGLFLSTKRHNRVTFPFITSDGAVGANKTYRAVFTIDFALNKRWNLRPADTFLDTRVFTELNIECQFSANIRDALLTGCDRTESNVACLVTVVGEYERPHSNFGAFRLYRQWKEVIPIAATNARFQYDLNVDKNYKELIISAQVQAAGGQFTGNDSLINTVGLKANANIDILTEIPFRMQQYLDCLKYGMTAIHPGCMFLDFDTDGMITEILSAYGATSLKLIFNETLQAGTNEIWIYPGVLEPYPSSLINKGCVPAAAVAQPMNRASA